MKVVPDTFDLSEVEPVSAGYLRMLDRWFLIFESQQEAEDVKAILEHLLETENNENY